MSRLEDTKWHAFESLYKTKEVLNELNRKRSYHEKPLLSEDEKSEIENKLLTFFHSGEIIILIFYREGYFYQKKGTVVKLVPPKIYFKDKTYLYFEQIIKILN